jgi:L-ascorbate metabolism protein UlaG (beta-lactamase superfamily)
LANNVSKPTQANEQVKRTPLQEFEQMPIPQDAVGIHWFGQSSFAFKDATGAIVLVDPFFPSARPADKFIHAVAPFDENILKVDYVLLTHDHGDHTCTESLLRIRNACPAAHYYGPQASIDRLRGVGFPDEVLSTVVAGDTLHPGNLTAHVVWAKPPIGVPADGIPVPDVEHLGYVLEIGTARIYVSGDIFNTIAQHDDFLEHIMRFKPNIGLLTLHPTEGEFPYFEGALALAIKLKLKVVVPAHYGCFVKRTYDPKLWAALFPPDAPSPVIIPYNDSIVFRI